jgi:hypothetical protein
MSVPCLLLFTSKQQSHKPMAGSNALISFHVSFFPRIKRAGNDVHVKLAKHMFSVASSLFGDDV